MTRPTCPGACGRCQVGRGLRQRSCASDIASNSVEEGVAPLGIDTERVRQHELLAIGELQHQAGTT